MIFVLFLLWKSEIFIGENIGENKEYYMAKINKGDKLDFLHKFFL